MQQKLTKAAHLNSFWLSLLLHLLILLSLLSLKPMNPEENNKTAHMYVPAYTAASMKASALPATSARAQTSKPTLKKSVLPQKKSLSKASILALTYKILHQEQYQALSQPKEEEPIYLIGDDNAVSDPLIKLIGRSLSAHFAYPKLAGELGIKGRVLIGFILHPQGEFTDIQLIKSSDNADLDRAALYAANSAANIIGADRFISRPKHFVVGFVFR
jgi:TonB family protein